MTTDIDPDRATSVVHQAITSVAPDTDPAAIDQDEDVWYTLDLDSMDQLNVMIAIGERLGIEIPEADYPQLETLHQLIDYVSAATA